MKVQKMLKRFFIKIIIFLPALVGFLMPREVSAGHSSGLGGYWGPLWKDVCGDGVSCTNLCELVHLLVHVVYFALTILVYIILPIAVVVGGLFIITAGGSTERLSRGKAIIKNAVLGAIIGLAAFLIINTFISLLGISGVSFGTIECAL